METLLSSLQTKNQKANEIAQTLIKEVFNSFEQKIIGNIVIIPDLQIELPIIRIEKEEVNSPDEAKKRIEKLQKKKALILGQLSNLQAEEQQELKQMKLAHKSIDSQIRMYRSEHSTEDVEKLKQLNEAKKKFQKQLELKTKNYEERIQSIKKQKQLLSKRQRQMKKQQRKMQAEKKLQEIQKRQEQRQFKIKNEQKQLIEIKKGKRAYQQMKSKWKQVQEEEQRKKQQLKEEIKRLKNIDFQEIKQHERRYEQMIREQRQSRVQKFSRVSSLKKIYYSPFLDNVMEQEKKKIHQEEEKKNQRLENNEKKNKYAIQIQSKHRSKLKLKKQEAKPKVGEDHRSLSFFDQNKKGNQYMKTINENLPRFEKKPPTEPKAFKYHNYLGEVRQGIRSKNKQEQQISRILKKNNLCLDQKFEKAKILAQKMENKNSLTNQKVMMDSINAKLMILKECQDIQ